ncbi:hypothetical protein [Brevibacterium casei]|uniref:hypothetical protein n=1 Tax=Brevibacterium casei TaxID=33889 RepID=UPI00223BAEFC|nr:hypothetical protein [Brevibacterium casei]MCT1549702.1 hypothetical protein [Brevibacterium casei]
MSAPMVWEAESTSAVDMTTTVRMIDTRMPAARAIPGGMSTAFHVAPRASGARYVAARGECPALDVG